MHWEYDKSLIQGILAKDQDSLVRFMTVFYEFMTKKTIEIQKKLSHETKGVTETFLLTETGLEKIDAKDHQFQLTSGPDPQTQSPEKTKNSGKECNGEEKAQIVYSNTELDSILMESKEQKMKSRFSIKGSMNKNS